MFLIPHLFRLLKLLFDFLNMLFCLLCFEEKVLINLFGFLFVLFLPASLVMLLVLVS